MNQAAFPGRAAAHRAAPDREGDRLAQGPRGTVPNGIEVLALELQPELEPDDEAVEEAAA